VEHDSASARYQNDKGLRSALGNPPSRQLCDASHAARVHAGLGGIAGS
jgi:hypothetical protein